MNKYDYIIVGAGLFGSICAHELNKVGYKILVIDKNSYIGGLCYSEIINNIPIHLNGPHLFHTSSHNIWEYINNFAKFHPYRHKVIANYNGVIYSMPINLMTMHQLWGVTTPEEAKKVIEEKREKIEKPRNMEEWILCHAGQEIYDIFFKEYTIKHWGMPCKDLPCSIIKRLPFRYTYDDYYYPDSDIYTGTPIGGYTPIFEKLLDKCDVQLNTEYLEQKKLFDRISERIIYTGELDKLYDYIYGPLGYRSVKYEYETILSPDCQGAGQINYTDKDTPYTRIIEYKHLHNIPDSNTTIIAKEFSSQYDNTNIPSYPINNHYNNDIYRKYNELSEKNNLLFGGRLASYRYYDMDTTIASALSLIKKIT